MIRSIIFDWHGVLDKTNFESLVEKLSILSNKNIDEVKNLVKNRKKEYASGKISPKLFWSDIKLLLNLDTLELKEAQQYSISIELNNDLWNMLPALSDNYTMAILSDCPLDKANEIKKNLDLSIFKAVIFSSEVKKMKDDDTFFLSLSTKLNIKPQDTLYIDDSLRHIEKVNKLGYIGYHYKNIEDLKKILL